MSAIRPVQDQRRWDGGFASIVLGLLGFGGGVVGFEQIDRSSPLLLLAGLSAIAGAGWTVHGARSLWLSQVLGELTLELPVAEPAVLGGTQVVRFHRTGGTRRASRGWVISAELVCREEAYQGGKNSGTLDRELYRQTLPVIPDPRPDRVAGTVEIEFPIEHPPSMSLRFNRIVWQLRIRVQVPRMPDDGATFEIPVLPTVARRWLGDRPQ